MGPCRVVANHSADRCSIGCCRIRSEEEPHGPKMQIELFLNHTGLDQGPAFFRIHLEHAIEIFRHVDDNCIAYGLTGETCSASPRQNRDFEITGHLHGCKYVLVSTGDHDAYW